MRAFFPAKIQDRIMAKGSWSDLVSGMQKLDFGIKSRHGLSFSMNLILMAKYALTYGDVMAVDCSGK